MPAKYYTVGEIAEDLRVSRMTVYRMVHSGELASIRVGRSFRIPIEAYQEFLRQEAQSC